MKIIAFFKNCLEIHDTRGTKNYVYVLVNCNGTYKIKRIIGEYKMPRYYENEVHDIKVENALSTFIDKAFDSLVKTENGLRANGEEIKSIEVGCESSHGIINNDIMDLVNTQLDTNTYDLSVLYAKTVITSYKRITSGYDICAITNERNRLYKLLKLSKDYVKKHPNEIVWLTRKYYYRYLDITTVNDWQSWKSSNAFVEHI